MPSTTKRIRMEISGDHLAAYIRPVIGALTAAASNTGYPKLGADIFLMASRLQKLAKRGKADELTSNDKVFLGMVLADALRSLSGRPELAAADGDTIALTVNPPVGKTVKDPAPVAPPQEILTLTGGLAFSVTTDAAAPGDRTVTAVLPGDLTGKATKDIPWDRTPAKYKGLPVSLDVTVPTLDEYIAIFNA